MDFFKWNEQFVTGLPTVDEQHHHLVDIINGVLAMLGQGALVEKTEVERLADQLLAYADYHFSDEERLMQQLAVDPRHWVQHRQQHRAFIEEVIRSRNLISDDADALRAMLNLLGHWLAYHMLGSDQSMARQIVAIRSGLSPEQAYSREQEYQESSADPLLHALSAMVELIMERNGQLLRMNETLESRVDERTRELQDAVEKLEAEMAESRRLGAELARANEYLRQMALTDVLTGLPNRRHALEHLAQLWSESQRHGLPLSCIMIDADGFKQVNDTYGHEAGDRLLCEVARTLRENTRQEDTVCRLGGDEFLILCRGTGLDGARRLAENLLARVNALRVPTGTGEWRGNLSMGVAEREASFTKPDDLVAAADGALYQAKRDGRNRVAALPKSS